MTNGTATGSLLQEEQKALLARIQEEPTTASVVEALDRLYSQYPASITFPMSTTTFGTGTNSNG
jgi:hypothetical protein